MKRILGRVSKKIVLYDNDRKNKSTLEYYKTFGLEVTVRVKVEPGNELKVKTVFPVTKIKIENRIRNEAYNKYVIKE